MPKYGVMSVFDGIRRKFLDVHTGSDILLCFITLATSMIFYYEFNERFVRVKTIWIVRLVLIVLVCGFFIYCAVRNGIAKKTAFGIFTVLVFVLPQLAGLLYRLTDQGVVFDSELQATFNTVCHAISRLTVRGLDYLTAPLETLGIPPVITTNALFVIVLGLYLFFYTGSRESARTPAVSRTN